MSNSVIDYFNNIKYYIDLVKQEYDCRARLNEATIQAELYHLLRKELDDVAILLEFRILNMRIDIFIFSELLNKAIAIKVKKSDTPWDERKNIRQKDKYYTLVHKYENIHFISCCGVKDVSNTVNECRNFFKITASSHLDL